MHYRADVELKPDLQYLGCVARLRFPQPENGGSEAVFFLHRQFKITEVSGEGVSGYAFDVESESPLGFMPDARPLCVRFASSPAPGRAVDIRLVYEGRITDWPEWSANVVTPDWIEVGSYLPWFPYNPEYGAFTFDVSVRVPPEFSVCSYVRPEREGLSWRFRQESPVHDIVLAASPELELRVFQEDGFAISLHTLTLSEETQAQMGKDLSAALRLYSEWFGGGDFWSVALVESARERGGGYARRGLIVLGGLDDQAYTVRHEAYLRYLGHEIAHFWWAGAPVETWEDWLNEGFAEYSALLLVRELCGQESFERRLQDKKATMRGTPPIRGFDRADRSSPERAAEAEQVLYSKAPVLLSELEQRVGRERFLKICRVFLRQEDRSTCSLLRVLADIDGEGTALWFGEELTHR
jgi:hypothetical protein